LIASLAYPVSDACLHDPEAAVRCFYDSIFGHVRNWPRAFSCLSAGARHKFGVERGLLSFADYWDDKLSFLEDLVKKRHAEYPYAHRVCFSLSHVCCEEISPEHAAVSLELAENHLSHERMFVMQKKYLSRQGQVWLMESGELDDKLDEIIVVRSWRRRSSRAGPTALA